MTERGCDVDSKREGMRGADGRSEKKQGRKIKRHKKGERLEKMGGRERDGAETWRKKRQMGRQKEEKTDSNRK